MTDTDEPISVNNQSGGADLNAQVGARRADLPVGATGRTDDPFGMVLRVDSLFH